MRMTASELRTMHESAHPDSFFFTRNNMRFAGDTMANFGVRAQPVTFETWSGDVVTCWELYRRRAVKHGLRASHYFDCETLRHVVRPDRAAARKRDLVAWAEAFQAACPDFFNAARNGDQGAMQACIAETGCIGKGL